MPKLRPAIYSILAILCFLTYIYQVTSLSCYCNDCGDEESSCVTANHRHSVCFKLSEKKRSIEDGNYFIDNTFGCISGADDFLGNLQCYTNTLKHHDVRTIMCCNDTDLCNYHLRDPTEKDNPRWSLKPDDNHVDNSEHSDLTFAKFTNEFITLTRVCYILTSIFILISLILLIFWLYSCCRIKLSKTNSGSLCSLKADLNRLHHNQHHHLNIDHHIVSISSASTHSYSLSDDLCHKSTPIVQTNSDDSYIPEDLTSGIGEVMFNQRTMARAVGFAKTDDVGSGRFGRVFRAQYHGDDVAVKAFSTIDQDSWKREDSILRLLNHENVVRFISSEVSSLDSNEIWMFLEYCPYGSLCDYLDQHDVVGPQHAIMILYSIINGLNYLHEDYAQASRLYKPSIAHRDIKSKNILMKTPESCCIADFGHALVKVGEENLDYGKYQHLQVGTVRYMAPEILRPNSSLNYRQFLTFALADVYQFGLIIWEVTHRTALDVLHPAGQHMLPYGGIVPLNPTIDDMVKIVCEDQYRPPKYEKWQKYPLMKGLSDLMVECWRPKSKARMETLGVKKRLKEMFDQVNPIRKHLQQLSSQNTFSLSSNPRSNCDKTKSLDVTL